MRRLLTTLLACLVFYAGASLVAGLSLPGLLLNPPVPARTLQDRDAILARLGGDQGRWTEHGLTGGGGASLDLWRLHRPGAEGVVITLHGFGDDAWGTAGHLADFPGFDGAVFTFRGRDMHPGIPCTLGAHEQWDVVSVVRFLEGEGVPRNRIILVAASQGAGVALLALRDLEGEGGPLGGALLESPFMDLRDAARNDLRGTLDAFEPFARPAERIALWRAGRIAGFDPDAVSPLEASRGLRTPVALLTGDADPITPPAGVRAIAAASHAPLTVVPGASHLEAGRRVPGGWKAWADERLRAWGF
jgi:alpha-beta hydrolase superfamily lysophospholipase